MGDVGGDVEGDVVLHGVRDSDMAARIRAHPDDAFDLVPGPNCGLEWRVRPDTSFGAFKALAAPQVGLPPERQRWWRFILRLNGTLRPSVLVDEDLTVGELRLYDPHAMSLVYLGHTLVAGMDTVGALEERLVRLMGLSHDTKLVLYEEVKLEPVVMVDVLPSRQMTLLDADLGHGDIILVQRALPAAEAASVPFLTADVFVRHLKSLSELELPPLPSGHVHRGPGAAVHGAPLACRSPGFEETVSLIVTARTTYEELAAQLARRLALDDSTRLRFTRASADASGPADEACAYRSCIAGAKRLYYEVLLLPLPQLESLLAAGQAEVAAQLLARLADAEARAAGTCVVCLEAPRSKALLPCRHVPLCGGTACAAALGVPPKCPLCRAAVDDFVDGLFL